MRSTFKVVVLVLALLLVAGGSFLFLVKFESQAPEVRVSGLPEVAGRKWSFTVYAQDARSGLREIEVGLIQGKTQTLLKKESFPVTLLTGSKVKEKSWSFEVEPLKLGLTEGEALVWVRVRDASWREGLKGNFTEKRVKIRLDLTPPRVTLLRGTIYIARGGSALVLYKLNENPTKSGVFLNGHFFRGYPLKEGVYAALVALSVEDKTIRRFGVYAEDKAGNSLELPVNYYLQKRRYPSFKMRISEGFLSRKMPEFISRYPEAQKASLVETFIWVNQTLRSENNQRIVEITSRTSEVPFSLKGAMLPLPRAAKRSDFGEFRTYYYQGRKISSAWHLGLDLASVAGSPVPAAADGRVVFADYLGIYGNTIIIDHGLGLYTLYAHLAGVEVSQGTEVTRGQIIGHTDTTGLAGGDHLHFSVIVQGVFVNPIEWLDPHWVKVRILEPLKPYLD